MFRRNPGADPPDRNQSIAAASSSSKKDPNRTLLRSLNKGVTVKAPLYPEKFLKYRSITGANKSLLVEFEIQDNIFTGKVLGVPCFREGKLSKVKSWAESHHYDLRRATFFSDSLNDLPLLDEVGRPVIVDGDSELQAVARTNNWECISLR